MKNQQKMMKDISCFSLSEFLKLLLFACILVIPSCVAENNEKTKNEILYYSCSSDASLDTLYFSLNDSGNLSMKLNLITNDTFSVYNLKLNIEINSGPYSVMVKSKENKFYIYNFNEVFSIQNYTVDVFDRIKFKPVKIISDTLKSFIKNSLSNGNFDSKIQLYCKDGIIYSERNLNGEIKRFIEPRYLIMNKNLILPVKSMSYFYLPNNSWERVDNKFLESFTID